MPKANRLLASFKWFLLLLAVLLALLASGVWWLTAAPRELTQVSAAIIARLQPTNASFEMQVGKVAFEWQSWRKPAHVRLEVIEIVSAEKTSRMLIPHGGVDLKMLPLLWGQLELAELQLFGVNATLKRDDAALSIFDAQGNLFVSIARGTPSHHQSADAMLQGGAAMLALAYEWPVETITLQSDSLSLHDVPRQRALQLQQSVLSVRKNGDSQLTAELRTELHLQDQLPASVVLTATYDVQQQTGNARLLFDALNPLAICNVAADCTALPQLDMPLAGGVQATLANGQAQTITLAIDGEQGTLAFAPHLPETIELTGLSLNTQINLIDKSMLLPKLLLSMQTGTRIEASGKAQYPHEQLSLELDARAEKMPVDHLYRYWPQGLAPATREWAITNIRGGMATEAETKIVLTPDDLETEFLPDDFLQARIEIEDSSIDYLRNFPKAEAVKATVYFTGATMSADIHAAKAFSSAQLAGSKLVMTDMNADGTPMTATLALKASASDAAQVLSKLPNSSLQDAAIMLQSATGGNVSADMELGFNAFGGDAARSSGDINWDALRYSIKAKLFDIADVDLHKDLPKQTLSGDVEADNNGFSLAFDGKDDASRHRIELAQKQGDVLRWKWLNQAANAQQLDSAPPAPPLQNISGTYADEAGITRLTISGAKLDLSPFVDSENESADNGIRLSELPPFIVTADVGELTVSAGQTLRQVIGDINCPSRCEPSSMSAQFSDGGKLNFEITRSGLQRSLRISSDRLGDTLRLIDNKGKVFEGTLDVSGVYNDALPQSTLSGKIVMSDFFLRDAPIIGRILNAGSLVGLLDTLKGDGIQFSKLTSDFTFSSDVLRLKDGKASGAAMGLLIEGDINLATNIIDISGNLAPAHVLNSLVGKVPLIGDLIVGGDGESVFAINYSARGDMDDPSVMVNPLSALTPGFTRRFFDMFEGERNTEMPAQKDAPAPPAEAVAPAEAETKWQEITP